MIHYDLQCAAGHGFDGWFKDSAGFDLQARSGLVECPVCGSTAVAKQLMAPALAKKGRSRVAEVAPPALGKASGTAPASPQSSGPPGQAATGPVPAQLVAMLQRMRAELEKNCDYVGPDFAKEARRLHREAEAGEPSVPRGIYGEASDAEAEALHEEGIEVARIPWVPPADA